MKTTEHRPQGRNRDRESGSRSPFGRQETSMPSGLHRDVAARLRRGNRDYGCQFDSGNGHDRSGHDLIDNERKARQ